MATKKSTKKSTKKAPSAKKQPILAFVLALIGVVVACMMFLPAIKIGDDTVVSGLLAAFGGEVTETVDAGVLGSHTVTLGNTLFNVGLFFAFLLPVIFAVVYAVFELLNAKLGRMLAILPTVAFIASAVLFFLGVKLFLGVNGDEGWISVLVTAKVEFKLGVGLILAGSFSVVGALAGLYTCYVKLVK